MRIHFFYICIDDSIDFYHDIPFCNEFYFINRENAENKFKEIADMQEEECCRQMIDDESGEPIEDETYHNGYKEIGIFFEIDITVDDLSDFHDKIFENRYQDESLEQLYNQFSSANSDEDIEHIFSVDADNNICIWCFDGPKNQGKLSKTLYADGTILEN